MAMAARTRARRTRAGATRRKTPHHPHVVCHDRRLELVYTHTRVMPHACHTLYIPGIRRGRHKLSSVLIWECFGVRVRCGCTFVLRAILCLVRAFFKSFHTDPTVKNFSHYIFFSEPSRVRGSAREETTPTPYSLLYVLLCGTAYSYTENPDIPPDTHARTHQATSLACRALECTPTNAS